MTIPVSFNTLLLVASVVFFCLAAAEVSWSVPLVPLGLACGFANFLPWGGLTKSQ